MDYNILKREMMKYVVEHQHPLKLLDNLQKKNPNEEESDDEEEDDLIAQLDERFVCLPCRRCDLEINVYHRYYYKCTNDSCNFSLHKFCAEVPTTIKHAVHPFPLKLYKEFWDWACEICRRRHRSGEVSYYYSSLWSGGSSFMIDVNCAVEVEKKKIQHPSHPHPLVSLFSKPILCECSACGKEHKGVFFHCTTCTNFAIHNDCATLPRSLLIQQTTNNIFHHTHPLTLSYSFLEQEKSANYYPNCRVCDGYFQFQHIWIYKCERCIYYAHLDCATSRRESIGKGQTTKNFKDADYPDLLRLPFPDQTYNIPKHFVHNEIGHTTYRNDKVSLRQMNHQHDLVLVDDTTECINVFGSTSSKITPLIKCHNPLKKIQLLCNVCLRPIMEVPFYKCVAYEDEGCNFTLHEWCTRLPAKVENHPGHTKHTLVLMSNVPRAFLNVFRCHVCSLTCNGYAYGCVGCKYYVDVTCGLMPENITHESHPNHVLRVKHMDLDPYFCHMCRDNAGLERYFQRGHLVFNCSICGVYIHPECALLLPETIRHTYDKHPMHLSYLPIENHKSEYFCEICEEKLNPHKCFYHCHECAQSVHSACAPLILCCETETHSEDRWLSMYKFLNVKFGSIHKIRGHPHRLSFEQGIKSDGSCNICHKELQYKMILKCVKCEFAIDYECGERLNKL